MISYETPYHELPLELRREFEAKAAELSDRHQYEFSTPHPEDPSRAIRPLDHNILVREIQAAKRQLIDRWNAETP
jgi:hypothetical protein